MDVLGVKEATEAKEATVKADRIASLVDGGVDKEVATSKVEIFANLSDEQFEVIAADIMAAAKKDDKKKDDKKDDDKKGNPFAKSSDEASEEDISKDDAEANADESVVDNAKSEEDVNLAVEASADESSEKAESARASIVSFLASRKGNSVEETETE